MSTYLFRIKRDDARRALEALYLEESVDPRDTLEELRKLQADLEEYVEVLQEQVRSRNGSRGGGRNGKR